MRALLAALLLLPLSTAVAPPAAAEGAVDCVVSGTAKFRPPLTVVPAHTTYAITLTLDCTGDPADTGIWTLVMAGGTSGALPIESCAHGDGFGTLSGSGPDGPVTGIIQVNRRAIVAAFAGQANAGGHPHQFHLDTRLAPRGTQNCATGIAVAEVTGSGFLGRI